MGNIMAKPKPVKEVIRENQRLIKKGVRELEKEISNLQRNEKKLNADIRKMVKQNQMGAAKVMVKDLVRTKKSVTKFIELKTHLNAVGLKIQTVKSTQAMTDAMKGVTKALVAVNKSVDLPSLNKIMAEFMKENEKNELMQETMGDAIDDAMEEGDTNSEEDLIMRQILDEIGTNTIIPEAPQSHTVNTSVVQGKYSSMQSFLIRKINFYFRFRP